MLRSFFHYGRNFMRSSSVLGHRNASTGLKKKKIGIVGVGMVGAAVAKNLLRGSFNLVSVHDIDPSKCSHLPSGIQIESSAREVVERTDVVITALPKPEHILQCFEGPDGLKAGLGPGKIWIDHSTTDYEQTQRFAHELQELGAVLLEAPITGGIDGLRRGQMTALVAGDKNVADEITPMLQASYKTVLYLGPLGNALVAKVLSNMLTGVHIMAAGEVLMVAKKSGIDLRAFWDAIRASAGTSFVWETGPPLVFNGNYNPDFSMDLICKDMHLGYEIAKKLDVPLELHGMVQQGHIKAKAQYGDEAGCYIIPKMLEDAMKEPLQVEGFDKWEYGITHKDGSLVVEHENIELK